MNWLCLEVQYAARVLPACKSSHKSPRFINRFTCLWFWNQRDYFNKPNNNCWPFYSEAKINCHCEGFSTHKKLTKIVWLVQAVEFLGSVVTQKVSVAFPGIKNTTKKIQKICSLSRLSLPTGSFTVMSFIRTTTKRLKSAILALSNSAFCWGSSKTPARDFVQLC